MSLEKFATQTAFRLEEMRDHERRLKGARLLAEKYIISRPEFILMVTHPDFERLPVRKRCERLGIMEEEWLLALHEPGMQAFIRDYQHNSLTAARLQAIANTGIALENDRYTPVKGGGSMENHDLEKELLKGIAAEKSGPAVQVNVQQNVWGQARQLAQGGK